ncbi:MAG: CYTH domain-containing protein [Patescibacteria group bacterium]|jgi:adenylate cyclase class 2
MDIEYEATFCNINKAEMAQRLLDAGAVLVKKEFLQRRTVFLLPVGNDIPGAWLRVRDEGDKITMSLKAVLGDKITDQKEICLTVNDYNQAVKFLASIGCVQKSYQENRREIWRLGQAEVTIDEWPFLEPFVEIEAAAENLVKAAAVSLGFDYTQAIFGSTDLLYQKRYGVALDVINNQTPRIVFDQPNPFLNGKNNF